MWKNILEPDRQQMTIWRTRIPCWITKATHRHTECVILIPFPTETMVARTRLDFTLYVHCLSCYGIDTIHCTYCYSVSQHKHRYGLLVGWKLDSLLQRARLYNQMC